MTGGERMTEREIISQISTIRQLHMVRVYHLFGENKPVVGALAYYQDKTINLCSADRHFQMLLDRLAKTYAREAPEGSIIADEETKAFLNKVNENPKEPWEELLSTYEATDKPLMAPKAFAYCYILPIVRYVIKTLTENLGETIFFEMERRPWFGKGTLEAVTGSGAVRFPYWIRMTGEGYYEVTALNVSSTGNVLTMEIILGREGITASYRDSLYLRKGDISLRIGKDGASVAHALKNDEGSIFSEVKECELKEDAVPTDEVIRLTAGAGARWKAYALPWDFFAYEATKDGERFRVFDARRDDLVISSAFRFLDLTEGDEPERFGKCAFRLYERDDVTELHFLELEEPGLGEFQERYAGRHYNKIR